MTQKGTSTKAGAKQYGLPDIGSTNVAGTLARRRPDPSEEEERRAERQESATNADIRPTKPTESTEPKEPTSTFRLDRAPEVARVETARRRPGRPKGPPSRRMHIAIEESLASYLDRAWRLHERPDGTLAAGPADLVEDLLLEHRMKFQRGA